MKLILVLTALVFSVGQAHASESCFVRDTLQSRLHVREYSDKYNFIRDVYTIECTDQAVLDKLMADSLLRTWYFQGQKDRVTYGIKNKIVGLSLTIQELIGLGYIQRPAPVRQSAGFCDYPDNGDKMCGLVIEFTSP